MARLDAHRRPVLTGVVIGVLIGCSGFLALSASSPTRVEPAVVTGNGISDPPGRPARSFVTGSTESGRSFRLTGRALYEYVESADGVIADGVIVGEAEVSRWTGRVDFVRAAGLSTSQERSWRGWWMAVGFAPVAAGAVRTLVGVRDRGIALRIAISSVVGAAFAAVVVRWFSVR